MQLPETHAGDLTEMDEFFHIADLIKGEQALEELTHQRTDAVDEVYKLATAPSDPDLFKLATHYSVIDPLSVYRALGGEFMPHGVELDGSATALTSHNQGK